MKRALLAVALLCLAGAAGADQLQFKFRVGSDLLYASFVHVRLLDAQNHQLRFEGDADRYGRINANVAHGGYQAVVSARGKTKSVNLGLTGSANLQVVTLDGDM